MDAHVSDVVRAMTEASDQERISFAEVVMALMEAGVERYHADLVTSTKTYYMPDGSYEELPCHPVGPVAMAFSAAGVEAAVRAIQGKSIKYREFCRRIADAGCAYYVVALTGQRAIYSGRTGDEHVEWFPGAR